MDGHRARIGKCYQSLKEHLPATPKNVEVKCMEKVCGVDVHRDLLVATILSGETETKETRHFVNDADDIDKLKEWLKST